MRGNELLDSAVKIEVGAPEPVNGLLRVADDKEFAGLQFDKQKLEPLLREGIKAGVTQLTLNPKKLGKEWREVLEGVVGR